MEICSNGKKLSRDSLLNEALKSAPVTRKENAIFVLRAKTGKFEFFNPFQLVKGPRFPEQNARDV